jgi:sulfatase modifying factor 1
MINALLRYGCFGGVLLVIALWLGQSSNAALIFVNSLGMRFVLIPSGTFMMGSHESAAAVAVNPAYGDRPGKVKWYKREHPLHRVTLTRPFLLQETEVTVAQFRAFAIATGFRTEAEREGWGWGYDNGKWVKKQGVNWRAPEFDQDDDYPVTYISWNDAQAFIAWLNREGKTERYRLPTEAEWEYACRAGSETPFYWGREPEGRYANFSDLIYVKFYPMDMHVNSKVDDGRVYTAPVANYRPNAFGLYDMSGNLNEWCQDWYSEYEAEDALDPRGPAEGKHRVLRGGSWCSIAGGMRSASRGRNTPNYSFSRTGFRLAWTY